MIICSDDPEWVSKLWKVCRRTLTYFPVTAQCLDNSEDFWAFDDFRGRWEYHGVWGEFHK